MTGAISLTYRDYSNEPSIESFNSVDITPANLAGLQTSVATYVDAVEAVTLGTIRQRKFDVVIRNGAALPSNPEAQREKKWDVAYVDNTPFLDAPDNTIANPGYGKTFHHEIPTANLASPRLVVGSDLADRSQTVWEDWEDAFIAFARSPYGGVPSITQIKFIGMNT